MTLGHLQRNAHKIKIYGQKYNENSRKGERLLTRQVSFERSFNIQLLFWIIRILNGFRG